jgi:outer membrane protein OmpA-like peptidoglycan-associated protein
MTVRSAAALSVAFALALGLAAAAPAQTLSVPMPLPGVRVLSLTPRVTSLRARVVALTPRVISVAPRPTGTRQLTVESDVLFAFDRSNLSPVARAVLAAVIKRLAALPSGVVQVAGYTDSIGTPGYNLGLSQRRAAAVAAYLHANINNPRLSYAVRGYGEADPVAPNKLPDGADNPAGRAKNRRVVIGFGS